MTCIGPIIEAARTAFSDDKPRLLKSARIWLITIPWSTAIAAKAIARNQKTGRRKIVIAAAFGWSTVSS
jgi:hypothetical protein